MLRHLLLVTCMNGVTRLPLISTYYQVKPQPWERTRDDHSRKQTLSSSTPVLFGGVHLCPLQPTAQSFCGLTVVPLDARFVPRNFDDIYVLIFQYVGIGSDSVGTR